MGQFTTIMARDGHEFQAWLAAAPARPSGALLVIQEIFGVTAHIRALTDGWAAEGYTAIAPSLFDRVRRGIELRCTAEERLAGSGYVKQLPPEATLRDIGAALAVVRHSGRAAVVGYGWGGTLAYRAACQLPVRCAVIYYGQVAAELQQRPKCPVMYHFGSADESIPPADIERIRGAQPQSALHLYEGAGHDFDDEQCGGYDPQAAALARRRTLEFITHCLVAEPADSGAGPGVSLA